MNVLTTIFPKPGDTPRGYLGGSSGDIPVLDFGASDYRLGFNLQFTLDDDAVRYCDELADAASGLAAKIRLHQAAAEVEPETSDLAVWRVVCRCGYVVEGLRREAAEWCASHHEDDAHVPMLSLGNTSVVPS